MSSNNQNRTFFYLCHATIVRDQKRDEINENEAKNTSANYGHFQEYVTTFRTFERG